MKVEYIVVSNPRVKGGHNEDANVVTNNDNGFVAIVADGHGTLIDWRGEACRFSPGATEFAADTATWIRRELGDELNPPPFEAVFARVAQRLEDKYKGKEVPWEQRPDVVEGSLGAVASCIVVVGGRLFLAQVGDCRLYQEDSAWRGGFWMRTHDHNANNVGEIERLRPVLNTGQFRFVSEDPHGLGFPQPMRRRPDRLMRRDGHVYVGGLEPTRAFGDWEYAPAVIPIPECFQFSLPSGILFALCSDGGNRIVEEILRNIHERRGSVSMDELEAMASVRFGLARDDVTIVFFRCNE